MGALYVNTTSGRAPARAALAQAQTEQQALSAQKTALAPAQTAHEQVNAAKKSLEAAMGSEVLWSGQLDALRLHLPAGVRLATLSVIGADPTSTGAAATAVQLPAAPAGTASSATATTGATPATVASTTVATVSMSGIALDNDAVANWLDALAGLPGWSNVYLTSTSANSTGALVNYSITANVTQAALSHRYTNGN